MFAALLMIALAGPVAAKPESGSSCGNLAALRSVDEDGRAARHGFQNGGRTPFDLWWIDQAGKRIGLGTIAPGGMKSVTTSLGHAFVLTDPQGKCRRTVRIDDPLAGSYVGTSRYRRAPIDGWRVYFDRALTRRADPGRAALVTLAGLLRVAQAVLPPLALAQLRRTPIFLHDHAGTGGMFHGDADWLVAHGRTVELLGAVEVSDAALFVETAREKPGAVLHELAHAYHARLPASEMAEIDIAYRRAMASGRYLAVRRPNGTVGPVYASANAAEYFAELSEAWFSRNNFLPFTRDGMAAYDPDGARLMARIWR